MKKSIGAIFCLLIIFINSHNIYPCTGFYIQNDNMILVGNNEDWTDTITKMWFIPTSKGNFGRVCFGYSNFYVQGGMNEQGLFFDGFSAPLHDVVNSKGKGDFKGNLVDYALATCTTVEEVIRLFKSYNLNFLREGMLFFGDAYGKSVIIEGDDFVINEGGNQICTNFCQSKTKPEDINCWRYIKVNEMLKKDSSKSVELCKTILQNVTNGRFTQYTNIYDLKKKKVYLYHRSNFNKVLEIDLLSELKKGIRCYDINSIFQRNEVTSEALKIPFNIKILYLFLILCAIIFISIPLVLIVIKMKILKKTEGREKSLIVLYKPTQIIASAASILILIYLCALSQYPELFYFGLPKKLVGLSLVESILIKFPLLVVILTIALVILLIIAFFRKLWMKKIYIIYSFVNLLIVINLVVLYYWNLIRF